MMWGDHESFYWPLCGQSLSHSRCLSYQILRAFLSTVKRMLNKQQCLESFKTTPEILLYFRQALRIFISILICRFKKANYDIIQT